MNSRDLCLINHLQELADAGIASFKIEGRMKNEHYVGGAVNAYRRAMNGEKLDFMTELKKLPNRSYTTGFTFNDQNKEYYKTAASISNNIIAAVVEDNNHIRIKNKIINGDELEILSPSSCNGKTFVYKGETANIPEQIIAIDCPYKLEPCDILCKEC